MQAMHSIHTQSAAVGGSASRSQVATHLSFGSSSRASSRHRVAAAAPNGERSPAAAEQDEGAAASTSASPPRQQQQQPGRPQPPRAAAPALHSLKAWGERFDAMLGNLTPREAVSDCFWFMCKPLVFAITAAASR
jgi:hypothetical protein